MMVNVGKDSIHGCYGARFSVQQCNQELKRHHSIYPLGKILQLHPQVVHKIWSNLNPRRVWKMMFVEFWGVWEKCYCWWIRNPANSPVEMENFRLFKGSYTCQVVFSPDFWTIWGLGCWVPRGGDFKFLFLRGSLAFHDPIWRFAYFSNGLVKKHQLEAISHKLTRVYR